MSNRTTLKKVVLPRHEESAGIIFALVCIPCEKYTLPFLLLLVFPLKKSTPPLLRLPTNKDSRKLQLKSKINFNPPYSSEIFFFASVLYK
jgi:hypothetical protein